METTDGFFQPKFYTKTNLRPRDDDVITRNMEYLEKKVKDIAQLEEQVWESKGATFSPVNTAKDFSQAKKYYEKLENEDFLEKLVATAEMHREKIRALREAALEHETESCTFNPMIYTKTGNEDDDEKASDGEDPLEKMYRDAEQRREQIAYERTSFMEEKIIESCTFRPEISNLGKSFRNQKSGGNSDSGGNTVFERLSEFGDHENLLSKLETWKIQREEFKSRECTFIPEMATINSHWKAPAARTILGTFSSGHSSPSNASELDVTSKVKVI